MINNDGILASFIDLSSLKYKEKDALEDVFKF